MHNEFPASAEELVYDQGVRERTDHLYGPVSKVVPKAEWPLYAPVIDGINRLKKERNAVILAHNYMTPEIFNCVGDITGDSLRLAQVAATVDQPVIVQAGVHFMAETAKILSPEKTVLIPDLEAGCSLAASITGEDVRLCRSAYSDCRIVTCANTSAEVKLESHICCTACNSASVSEAADRQWGTDSVIMIPDEYLAKNVASPTKMRT